MALRLVFMGTPDFAVPTLTAIFWDSGHDVAAVYTRAPKPAGRGMELAPSPVAREAQRFGIPVLTPTTLKTPQVETALRAHGAQAAVVVAYGLILPKPILAAFPLGAFNLHASLLPRWRGAAPINRAIMTGDRETGVTVMKMDEGLDTGATAMAERVPIGPDTTAGELHDTLAQRGAGLMMGALAGLERGALAVTPQPQTGVSYAAKIDKGETAIDWTSPWKQVHDHVRGLSPFPGAWTQIPSGGKALRIKVLRTRRGEGTGAPGTVLDRHFTVACGEGAVGILELQRAGRQAMNAEDFLRGTPLVPGTKLG